MSASCDVSCEVEVVFAFKRLNPLVIPVVANADANKPTEADSHVCVQVELASSACVSTNSRLVTNTWQAKTVVQYTHCRDQCAHGLLAVCQGLLQ